MSTMNSYTIDTTDGKTPPEYLVVFLHGHGSSGGAMSEYAGGLLAPLLPHAKIIFPDGPMSAVPENLMHMLGGAKESPYRSWFDMRDIIDKNSIDTADRDKIGQRATAAATAINAYVDAVAQKEGVPLDHVIIAGFSQGGTMAYYSGLLRVTEIGGVFCLSGGALDRLGTPQAKPPIGIAAGELETQDYSGAPHARKVFAQLEREGFYADCAIITGKKHEISPKSMELLSAFTRAVTSETFKTRRTQELKAAAPRLN